MREVFVLPTCRLIEVWLGDLFPEVLEADIHAFVKKEDVQFELLRHGYHPVTEPQVLAFAKATNLDQRYWPPSQGHCFLMDPIVRVEKGEVVNYCGPYEYTGTEGYELALWRDYKEDEPEKEKFPKICRKPVNLGYRAISSLVVRAYL